MDEGFAALLGAVVGGLITAGATVFQDIRRSQDQAKSLAIAIAGEAAAVAMVVRRREWLKSVAGHLYAAQGGQVSVFTVLLPEQIFAVARGAQAAAGTLPGALPSLVPRLVLTGDGVAADLKRLFDHPVDDARSLLRSDDAEGAVNVYGELLAMMASALTQCDSVVAEVKRLYPKEAASLSTTRAPFEIELFPEGIP